MKRILPLGAALVSVAFLSNVVHAGLAQSGTVGVGAVVGESPSTLEVKVLDIASGDVVRQMLTLARPVQCGGRSGARLLLMLSRLKWSTQTVGN
jgi:hypothetical protein